MKSVVCNLKWSTCKLSHWMLRQDLFVRQPRHTHSAEGHPVSSIECPVFSKRFIFCTWSFENYWEWSMPQRPWCVCQSNSSVRESSQIDILGTQKELWLGCLCLGSQVLKGKDCNHFIFLPIFYLWSPVSHHLKGGGAYKSLMKIKGAGSYGTKLIPNLKKKCILRWGKVDITNSFSFLGWHWQRQPADQYLVSFHWTDKIF